jgi:transcription-repair coupling factor (superfamily II helicase)
MAHGQLEAEQLENALVDFIDRKFDVLVCTNIIETGLDIPNANTMIINNAHEFGLSDLHQLRGRIGRSNKKAYCYLFTPPTSTLTTDARKRLRTIEEHSDLGSGFEIAMRDLDIRGAGNLLGAEQSGFIADIGYETFQRVLEEAVQELKESDFRDVFREELSTKHTYVRDVNIDTDVEMHIPDDYVSSVSERLNLYTTLDELETEEALYQFESQLRDRFGKVPPPVMELFEGLRLRWVARELGFERIILKDNKLRCYFLENPQSPYYDSPVFQRVFQFIASRGQSQGLHLKKSTRSLIMAKDQVKSLKAAREVLKNIRQQAM